MKTILSTIAMALFLSQGPALAEVVSVNDNGFTVKANVHVNAKRDDAFKQLLNIGDWWNSSHTWFGDAKAMSIDPKAGGCWCEIVGDQSSAHGIVSQIDPGKLLRLNAQLGPLQEMAVTGVLTFKLEEMGSGAHLYATYTVNGFSPEGAQQWSEAVNFVINEQVTRYGRLLNTGKADQ
jgi:hypothetical protein